MYVKYSARRQIRPSTCTTRLVHISVYQTKERSAVVWQVLSSLSQWPYGNTFHCTHRHKSAANITAKDPHTPKSSQTVTAINGTEPSWELQILLKPKPVDKCYNTASVIQSHRLLLLLLLLLLIIIIITIIIKIKSEEPRPTELVTPRWQQGGLVVSKALILQP